MLRRTAIGLMLALLVSGCQTTGNSSLIGNPSELKRTWDAAIIYLPDDGLEIPFAEKLLGPDGTSALELIMKGAVEQGDLARMPKNKRYPVIIYLHGCTGLYSHDTDSGIFLASQLNAVVIQPDSFAREYRPTNCNPRAKSGGTFRPAVRFRIEEANYAIREARKFSWVDSENVFLMGFSEGGYATAKFTGEPVNARIIEGAPCHAGWPDWNGLDAPESEPVLSLLAQKDPWYQAARHRGKDCGSKMSKTNGSRSIVVTKGPYANGHAVLMDPDIKAAVKEFFKANLG